MKLDVQLDMHRILQKSLKYFTLGLAVILLLLSVPKNCKLNLNEILIVSVGVSLVYGLLDVNMTSV